VHAGVGHLVVGRVAHELGGCARRFDVGIDGVAGGAQAEGEEGGADIGCYAGEDYLLFACGFDGGAERGVVPGAVRGSEGGNWQRMGAVVLYFALAAD
jgi:hypothetical protein